MTSIKSLLKKNILSIKFKKQDGTERTMKCTLLADMLPFYEKKTERVKTPNENVLCVWDVEKNDFRSFRIDSLTEYSIVREGYEL